MFRVPQVYFLVILNENSSKVHTLWLVDTSWGFPGGSDGKESACSAGDLVSIPRLRRSPGEGNGYRLQYFAWEISWTEEPGRLQSMRSQRVGMTEHTRT